ncbi:MAG: hypothetical protein R3B06_02710 [Kofleriaceae bacterium]
MCNATSSFRSVLVVVAAAAAAGACSKADKKAEPAPGTATDKPGAKTPPPAKASGPFADWDMAGRAALFAGAHVVPGQGGWEAWDVQGDKVTITTAAGDKTLDFEITSPCTAKVTERSANGSSGTIHKYTVHDGAIALGLGDAGVRKGADAVACVSNKIFVLAGGVCTMWSDDFGRMKSEPGTCALDTVDGKDVFKATVNARESQVPVEGDTIWTVQLAGRHSDKLADLAAAKAAMAERR